MRFLHDHSEVRYERRGNYYGVTYRGMFMGRVQRTASGRSWGYCAVTRDPERWTGGFETRKDAADHLISFNYPSAAWLV